MTQRKRPPHSSFRVPCGLREGIQDLQPHPEALKDVIISRARLQESAHQADPRHIWSSLDELGQSYVGHPVRDDLQRVYRNADERDYVRMV